MQTMFSFCTLSAPPSTYTLWLPPLKSGAGGLGRSLLFSGICIGFTISLFSSSDPILSASAAAPQREP
jgi:hypothetical protein